MNAPAGFVPYSRPSRYLELIGPVFQSATDAATVGLMLDERHGNARGFAHAGVPVALADTLMGHTAQRAGPPDTRLVTVSLSTISRRPLSSASGSPARPPSSALAAR